MVDKKLTSMLDESDPELRKIAIKKMAQTGDASALPYLAAVYKSDVDSEVRELARKAGIYIKQQSDSFAGRSTPRQEAPSSTLYQSSIYGDNEDEADEDVYTSYTPSPYTAGKPKLAKPERAPDVEVSEKNKAAADNSVKKARRALTRRRYAAAFKHISKALQLNPNLRNDIYTVDLAAEITGLGRYQVLGAIDSGTVTLSDGRNRSGGYADPQDAEWSDALIDLLIYGMMHLLITVIGMVTITFIFNTTFNEMTAVPEIRQQFLNFGVTEETIASFAGEFSFDVVIIALIFGGITAVFSIVLLMFYAFIFHMSATMVLGGDGTMTGLIHAISFFLSILVPIEFLLGLILSLPLLDPQLESLLLAGNILYAVVSTGWLGRLIGKAYNFGLLNGLYTIGTSFFILFLITCSFSFLITLYNLGIFG